MGENMKIYSIFNSIDGEVNYFGQGSFTTFIRFAGCNFSPGCSYCDTQYAQNINSGKEMTADQILKEVRDINCPKVTITGGEPLFQAEGFQELTKKLWHSGFLISVETNGSLPIEGYGVTSWVADCKLPSSGMSGQMKLENFCSLRVNDYVKFVISDREDYETAKDIIYNLGDKGCRAKFLFSPVFGILGADYLVRWIQQDGLWGVQVNVQLHKYMLPNEHK